MPTRLLPANASLSQLKVQAKDLLRAQRAHEPASLQRLREFHPRFRDAQDDTIATTPLKLSDAQFAIAREYGFRSWPRLKSFVERPQREDLRTPHHLRITDPLFRRAVDLIDAGDADGLRSLLNGHPDLARKRLEFEGWNYFQNPALVEFVAGNPSRHERVPENTPDLARIILEAGGRHDRESLDNALGLAASSAVARISGVQESLINVLCDYGADPRVAHYPAALYAEFDAVVALIGRGLPVDLLVATELNRIDDLRATVALADGVTLQKALAMAAQFGYTTALGIILDAGADPNRYAPVGGHSHATPLHQAALGGHLDAVRLLIERGARTDIRDIHHDNTPLEWARYGKQDTVAKYLENMGH
jgi:ankyrin repeat protein